MAKLNDNAKRFARAVALFRAGKFTEAAAIFAKIAAKGGALAAKARAYLARITASRGGKAPVARRAKGKRVKAAKPARKPAKKLKKKPKRKKGGRHGGPLRGVTTWARPALNPQPLPPAPPPNFGSESGPIFRACAGCVFVAAPPTRQIRRDAKAKPAKRRKKKGGGIFVSRTPHMDIRAELPVRPGTAFDLEIFVDQEAPAPGEISTTISVLAGTRVEIHLLVSEHFLIDGPTVKWMVIDAAPASERVSFRLAAKPADQLPAGSTPSITALFMGDGRPCGMVRRDVPVGDITVRTSEASPARVEIAETAPADLHVTVIDAGSRDGRTFQCLVQTRLLDAFREPVSETWVLRQDTNLLVQGLMKQFTATNASPAARIASLRGAGRELFAAAPKNFRTAFWALIDSGMPFHDIAVVSEELYIPWELMIPSRQKPNRSEEERQPLGMEFRIGRWTTPDMVRPRQMLNLFDSYVIAPNYADVRKRLKYAQDEANFVATQFNGVAITPVGYDDVEQKLKGGRTLLHFVCHGVDNSSAGFQTIDLENDQSLTSVQIMGIEGLRDAFRRCRPIIFLNACEVGRLAPALTGLGGFAAAFIDAGAGAVIAPLWSVKDEVAHQVAVDFYGRVGAEPGTPFAEILRSIRAKAYDRTVGEDTYAAYCFYGDPAAFADRSPPQAG
jgi:CHAT domain